MPVRRTEPSLSVETRANDGRLDALDLRPHCRSGSSHESLSESESLRQEPTSGKGSSVQMIAPDRVERFSDGTQRREGDRVVEAEGLIWVDSSQRTAYSVRCVCVCSRARVSVPGTLAAVYNLRCVLGVLVGSQKRQTVGVCFAPPCPCVACHTFDFRDVAGAVPSMLSGVRAPCFPSFWCNTPRRVLLFCRHGYRIDVQGAQDSVSGLEYGRILSQMRGGSAADEHGTRASTGHVTSIEHFE